VHVQEKWRDGGRKKREPCPDVTTFCLQQKKAASIYRREGAIRKKGNARSYGGEKKRKKKRERCDLVIIGEKGRRCTHSLHQRGRGERRKRRPSSFIFDLQRGGYNREKKDANRQSFREKEKKQALFPLVTMRERRKRKKKR